MTYTQRSYTVGGRTRTAHVHVPKGATKLLIAFHGGGGTGTGFSGKTLFHERTSGWVIAYPDGIDGGWNSGDYNTPKSSENTEDDVAFFDAMVLDAEQSLGIEVVACTGHSLGAQMCYRIARERSLLAIAPVGGVPDQVTPPAGPAVNLLHQHGLTDPRFPYAGGIVDGDERSSVSAVWDAWNARDGLGPVKKRSGSVHPGEEAFVAEGAVRHVLCPIKGLGHLWPGDDVGALKARQLGGERPDLDGTGAILSFLDGL